MPNHKWIECDEVVALYLARKYNGVSEFKTDLLTKRLLFVRPSMKLGSLRMAIQNFYFLLRKSCALSSVSALGRQVFEKYKDMPLDELRNHADTLMNAV